MELILIEIGLGIAFFVLGFVAVHVALNLLYPDENNQR